MIMRCKQSFCTDFMLVRNIFKNSLCYTHSIICRCTSADFVEYNQTLLCGILKDFGNLIHFNHKSRLPRRQIIGCAYTCENTVNKPYFGTLGRNKASHLRHKNNYGNLTHIGRLTCHIRSGYYKRSIICTIKSRIIRYKWRTAEHFFYDRMSSVNYAYTISCIDCRARIII